MHWVPELHLSLSLLLDDRAGKHARNATVLSGGVDGIRETESGRSDEWGLSYPPDVGW
jgi:hypothetical protein